MRATRSPGPRPPHHGQQAGVFPRLVLPGPLGFGTAEPRPVPGSRRVSAKLHGGESSTGHPCVQAAVRSPGAGASAAVIPTAVTASGRIRRSRISPAVAQRLDDGAARGGEAQVAAGEADPACRGAEQPEARGVAGGDTRQVEGQLPAGTVTCAQKTAAQSRNRGERETAADDDRLAALRHTSDHRPPTRSSGDFYGDEGSCGTCRRHGLLGVECHAAGGWGWGWIPRLYLAVQCATAEG
jgi:hypothetical protein